MRRQQQGDSVSSIERIYMSILVSTVSSRRQVEIFILAVSRDTTNKLLRSQDLKSSSYASVNYLTMHNSWYSTELAKISHLRECIGASCLSSRRTFS